MLREYDDVKEEIKILKTSSVRQRLKFILATNAILLFEVYKNTEAKNPKSSREK